MIRRFAPLICLAALLVSAGCRSHSLRAGRWRLEMNLQDLETKEAAAVPSSDVRLAIEWKEGGGELIELTPLEPGSDLSPIWGDIAADSAIVELKNQRDPYWVFTFQGKVTAPDHVNGTAVVARHRFDAETILTGRWELHRVSD